MQLFLKRYSIRRFARLKKLLPRVFAILGIILLAALVFLPLWSEEQAVTAQLTELRHELQWLREMPEFDKSLAQDYDPPKLSDVLLIRYLDAMANDASLKISELELGEPLTNYQLQGYVIRLRLNGNFETLDRYLGDLEETDYLIQIRQWSFARDYSDNDSLSLHLELIFWGQEGDDEEDVSLPGGRKNPFTVP